MIDVVVVHLARPLDHRLAGAGASRKTYEFRAVQVYGV